MSEIEKLEAQLSDHCLTVFRAVHKAGGDGVTCEEVEESTGLKHQTASARLRELQQKGFIETRPVTRKAKSGRSVTVWRSTIHA